VSDYPDYPEDPSESSSSGGNGRKNSSRLLPVLTVVALVVALAAAGVATWALLRSPSKDESGKQYTDAQRKTASDQACAAYDVVWKGLTLNANRPAPDAGPDDPGVLSVAANGRISLSNGGQYMLARIDPATPTDLADSARKFGNKLLDIGAWATAGMADNSADQTSRMAEADSLNSSLFKLCNPGK
jgi:hypothetical protein